MKTAHKKMFVRNALSVAVLAALATPAFAEVDGWDFSGQNARSQALQSDYNNLVDSYNIWVNPALVAKHSNRIDINITEGIRDDEGAGIYKTFGVNTVGAFIGRPSDSLLSGVNLSGFNSISGYAAGASALEPVPLTLDIEDPRNQFDLFYAWSGPVLVGARLNFQAITEEHDRPTYTSQSPNVFQATDTSRSTSTVSQNSSEVSAKEFNLALGVADPAGNWDATLLWGRPSAKSKVEFADRFVGESLFPAGTVVTRGTDTFSGSQTVEDDGAQNLGLTGRLINIIPASIITLGYQAQDYGYKSAINGSYRSQFDATLATAVLDFDETNNLTETGDFTLKGENIKLLFTKNFSPMPSTLVLATVGWVNSSSEAHTVNTVTTNSTVDNIAGTTTYNNGTPFLGKQTNIKAEFNSNALPLVLGVEGDVNSNWTLRAAVSKDLFVTEKTETTTEVLEFPATGTPGSTTATPQIQVRTEKHDMTRVWDTDTTLTLGAGYKKGSLAIDAVVLKQFVTRGFDEGLVSRLSVTWSI